jgi:hypothetical protein
LIHWQINKGIHITVPYRNQAMIAIFGLEKMYDQVRIWSEKLQYNIDNINLILYRTMSILLNNFADKYSQHF